MINETANWLEVVFSENGFSYEPISIPPAGWEENSEEKGDIMASKSRLLENKIVDSSRLQGMFANHEFKPFAEESNQLLVHNGKYCRTFTGDPKCLNKKMTVFLREMSFTVDNIESMENSNESTLMEFSGHFKSTQ